MRRSRSAVGGRLWSAAACRRLFGYWLPVTARISARCPRAYQFSVPVLYSAGGKADMIKKVKGGYKVVSSKGKNLGGPYKTLDEAKKRLRQVEFFKHRRG